MKSPSEFDIIKRYFVQQKAHSSHTVLGIGDDAAVLQIPPHYQLVTSMDTLHENRHFLATVDPFDLGYKSLAVSVSDMAAMAAQPFSALLSLSMPEVATDWLQAFSAGFFALADQFAVDLVGGDLTRGPLSVTTVVNGIVPTGKVLRRDGAAPGDLLYVTGCLGDAGLALHYLNNGVEQINPQLLSRLTQPMPRIRAAYELRDIASSAMDISDGLCIDLSRLCRASGVGAHIQAQCLPLSTMLLSQCDLDRAQQLALSAGDDYELLVTVPPHLQQTVEALVLDVPLTLIGKIVAGAGVFVLDANGVMLDRTNWGYDHFCEEN